jgi:hypothetical protein
LGTECTTVELLGVGLDRGLPLSSTGIRSRRDLDTDSTAGQWFTVAVWLVQAAVWGLATLALAALHRSDPQTRVVPEKGWVPDRLAGRLGASSSR